MEIRHLRGFCAIAQEMHVTRAAAKLRIAQPALTQQIRLLEKDLGVSLLRRTGRGIALTEAGEFFYREAVAILDQLHNAGLKAREIARGDTGHLRIGVTEGASFHPDLASVFTQFRAERPAVSLTFSQKQTVELANDLRNGVIDAAFMCPVTLDREIKTAELYDGSMLLAVPSAHVNARKSSIHLRDLKDEPMILVSHGETINSLASTLTIACAKLRFTPRILQTTPDFMLALNLVASGIGSTFVPAYMRSIYPETIAYLRVETPLAIKMQTVLAIRASQTPPAVAHLYEMAVRTFQKVKNSPSLDQAEEKREKPKLERGFSRQEHSLIAA